VCVCVNIRVWAMTWQKYKREEKEKRLTRQKYGNKEKGEIGGATTTSCVCAYMCARKPIIDYVGKRNECKFKVTKNHGCPYFVDTGLGIQCFSRIRYCPYALIKHSFFLEICNTHKCLEKEKKCFFVRNN